MSDHVDGTGNSNATSTWSAARPGDWRNRRSSPPATWFTVTADQTVRILHRRHAAITVAGPAGSSSSGPTSRSSFSGDVLLNRRALHDGARRILSSRDAARPRRPVPTMDPNGAPRTNNNVVITITGTSGARCQIRSNAPARQFVYRWDAGPNFSTIRIADFTRMGTASVAADRGHRLDLGPGERDL